VLVRTNSVQDAEVMEGKHPVVVFGPMWGGRRTQDTFLAEELASHGYVVAAVDHPGNAGRVEMSDGTVVKSTMAGALSDVEATGAAGIEALWAKELAVWARDVEFVLDEMEGADWLRGRVDMEWVGALGHSFGGSASMALLGADKRVKCAVNMDGWTFNGLAKRTTQAVMFVYEGSGEARGRNAGAEGKLDADDNAAVDASLARFGGLRAYGAGTQHLDFTDQTLVSPLQRLTYTGPIKGERVRTILRGMIVGFFDEALKGEGGVPEFPEVRMERHLPRVLAENNQE
jgi:dienelactone hydrolase